MRYETPNFTVVGDASELVLGLQPVGIADSPDNSTDGDLLLGLDD
jgi:hypothetical protein